MGFLSSMELAGLDDLASSVSFTTQSSISSEYSSFDSSFSTSSQGTKCSTNKLINFNSLAIFLFSSRSNSFSLNLISSISFLSCLAFFTFYITALSFLVLASISSFQLNHYSFSKNSLSFFSWICSAILLSYYSNSYNLIFS